MRAKTVDAQGTHIYPGFLAGCQLRDYLTCDRRQRNAFHSVAGSHDDVVIAAGAPDIGQAVRGAGAQPAPDLN